MLMINPTQIIIFLVILLFLVVFSLFLASKSQSNTRFLLWGALILFVPFIGALVCIISYYSNRETNKEVKLN